MSNHTWLAGFNSNNGNSDKPLKNYSKAHDLTLQEPQLIMVTIDGKKSKLTDLQEMLEAGKYPETFIVRDPRYIQLTFTIERSSTNNTVRYSVYKERPEGKHGYYSMRSNKFSGSERINANEAWDYVIEYMPHLEKQQKLDSSVKNKIHAHGLEQSLLENERMPENVAKYARGFIYNNKKPITPEGSSMSHVNNQMPVAWGHSVHSFGTQGGRVKRKTRRSKSKKTRKGRKGSNRA